MSAQTNPTTNGTPPVDVSPPCRVLLRSKQKLELFTLPSEATSGSARVLLDKCTSTIHTCTAPDGSFTLVHVSGVGIVKCDLNDVPDASATSTPPPVAFFARTESVQMMQLSPSGTYLLTWERWKDDPILSKNLKVFHCATGKLLAAFSQKNIASESWPYLQWTMDEAYAFLLSNNSQIRVYTASDIASSTAAADVNAPSEPRFVDKLQIPSCTTLSVHRHAFAPIASTTALYYLTTFSKKTKDKPSAANIYTYAPQSTSISTESAFALLATKSLFQAEECTTRWSPVPGTPACLLTLQTAVDATGQSYYGNSQLWLWTAASASSLSAVPLPQEGPVQDCQWLPDPVKPASFIVIAGNMPAMASQHHGVTGAVTFLFGNNVHRNTVATCAHFARFVCLAGFGNLAGGMGFWDLNKKKLIPHVPANVNGTLRSEPVTMHGWSPDARHFITATTAPRMNVDNGARLYKYSGELVTDVPWNNGEYQPNLLLEASFVPAVASVYTDRPQSPVPERLPEASGTTATAMTSSAVSAPAATAGRYVPPSARNRAGGSSLAERLRAEKQGSVQGATKVVTKTTTSAAVSAVTGRVIPGLTVTQPASAKSKSQIKREKLKLKSEAVSATTSLEVAPVAPPAPPEATTAAHDLDPEKRARKLKKILKQIVDLKSMAASDLNDDQKAKVASEESVRAELAQLGV